MASGDSTWQGADHDASVWEDGPGQSGPASFLTAISHAVEAELARNFHQLPLFVPVGLGLGIVAWFSGGAAALWPVVAVAAILFALGGWMERGSLRRSVLISLSALILIGFVLISWRAHAQAGQALDKPWFGRFYGIVERVEAKAALNKEYLYLNTQSRQGLPENVRVSRPLDTIITRVEAGDTIIVRARLMPPAAPAVPGAYDFSERAFFMGIGATGSAMGRVRVIEHGHSWARSQALQRPLSQFVQSRMSGDAGAIAATLASGDRSAISAQADEWMRGSGMAHLLSISGLHVTALVGVIYLIVSRILALFPFIALRANIPLIAAAAGAAGAVFYTWLTGGEVPTIRSCIAALLILAALAIGREPLSMRVLAIGATVVIVLWPEAIMGPSFQLSFAAVAAIIALHDMPFMRAMRDRAAKGGWAHRFGNGMVSLFLTGLLVELTLSPIALYHFQQTGLYGALANMIAIPMTTFLIMPMVALSLAVDWTGLALPLWAVTGGLLDVLLVVAKSAATAPGAKVLAPTFAPWSFGIFAIGVIWLYLLTTKIRWAGLALIAAGVLVMLTTSAPDILIDSSGRHMAISDTEGRAYFLHAGQGEFVRDMMQEQMGQARAFSAIEDHAGARCNAHICLITVHDPSEPVERRVVPNTCLDSKGGCNGDPLNIKAPMKSAKTSLGGTATGATILVTRSNQYLDYSSLIAACAAADIAISDRPLPKDCRPKWIKADLYTLRKTGGLAIYLAGHRVETVAETQQHLPWSTYNPENRPSLLAPHQ